MYGYGVKGFTLCAIETVAHLAGSGLTAEVVRKVLCLGRGMLTAPVELLPGAAAAVTALRAAGHRLVLVTKGDLIDQERKLAASGLADNFDHVAVLSDTTSPKYTELLRLLDCPPAVFLMVGNSLRSDVGPVRAIDGRPPRSRRLLPCGSDRSTVRPCRAGVQLEGAQRSDTGSSLRGQRRDHSGHLARAPMHAEWHPWGHPGEVVVSRVRR